MQEITANMAGMVLKLLVNPGDVVNSGQDLVIIESMKMEVPISAINGGTVKEMKVNIGDFVNEGDLMLVIE